jgi:hypothetical protein
LLSSLVSIDLFVVAAVVVAAAEVALEYSEFAVSCAVAVTVGVVGVVVDANAVVVLVAFVLAVPDAADTVVAERLDKTESVYRQTPCGLEKQIDKRLGTWE